jgi:hypothetical protein
MAQMSCPINRVQTGAEPGAAEPIGSIAVRQRADAEFRRNAVASIPDAGREVGLRKKRHFWVTDFVRFPARHHEAKGLKKPSR